jgi:20S proteasome subunit beta 4
MDCVIGIQGHDFVLLAGDTIGARSILKMKHDANKILKMGKRMAIATVGESGDTDQFGEYIQRNVELYKMRNDYELDTQSAAHFTRRTIAEYLRSRTPYSVNVLLGGVDELHGASLFFLDYLGTQQRVAFACHGYASYLALSVLDRSYRADLSRDDALALLRACIEEVQHRLVISLPRFNAVVIDKDGIRDVPALP